MSPLRQFVLAAMLWLPAMFFVWFALDSAVAYPVIRGAAWLVDAAVPGLLDNYAQEFHRIVFSYRADLGPVAGLPARQLLVEEQRSNVLVFCYSLPLFLGLVMATPLNWRRVFLQAGIGIPVLLGVAALGAAAEILFLVLFGAGPAVQTGLAAAGYGAAAEAAGQNAAANMLARFAESGWNADLVALCRQFGYLILPAVSPIVLWILMNRRFLEQLVGWRAEDETHAAEPAGAGDAGGESP